MRLRSWVPSPGFEPRGRDRYTYRGAKGEGWRWGNGELVQAQNGLLKGVIFHAEACSRLRCRPWGE